MAVSVEMLGCSMGGNGSAGGQGWDFVFSHRVSVRISLASIFRCAAGVV